MYVERVVVCSLAVENPRSPTLPPSSPPLLYPNPPPPVAAITVLDQRTEAVERALRDANGAITRYKGLEAKTMGLESTMLKYSAAIEVSLRMDGGELSCEGRLWSGGSKGYGSSNGGPPT